MNDKRKKLYQGLVDEGLYSKSYEEFENQFSNPESRRNLYSGLVDENLYSKGYEDFEVQFFSDLQKKNPDGTSSTEFSTPSPTGSPQADVPTAAGSSKLQFLGRRTPEQVRGRLEDVESALTGKRGENTEYGNLDTVQFKSKRYNELVETINSSDVLNKLKKAEEDLNRMVKPEDMPEVKRYVDLVGQYNKNSEALKEMLKEIESAKPTTKEEEVAINNKINTYNQMVSELKTMLEEIDKLDPDKNPVISKYNKSVSSYNALVDQAKNLNLLIEEANSHKKFLEPYYQELDATPPEMVNQSQEQPVDEIEVFNDRRWEPAKNLIKSFWGPLKYDIPATTASSMAAMGPEDYESLRMRNPEWFDKHYVPKLQEKHGDAWEKGALNELKETRSEILRWALDRSAKGAEYKRELIQSWDDVNDPIDLLNFISSAVGQSMAQIPVNVATAGASGIGQSIGGIYMDEVQKLAKEYEITPEEVIDRELDDQATAIAFGFASGALDKLGADKVLGVLSKTAVGKALRIRAKDMLKVAGNAAFEGLTEAAQSVIEQTGASIGAGEKPEIDLKQVRDEATMGVFGGGAISAATTVAEFNKARKEKAADTSQPAKPTTEQPETRTEPPPLERVVAAKKKAAENKLELGAEVEYQGKKMKVVDEQVKDDETVESFTLQDEEGNEVNVAPEKFYAETNKELAGVDPEALKVVDMIEREQEKTAPPKEPGEVKVYTDENIDQIATDNPNIPFLEPLVNAFKAVEGVKSVIIHPNDESFQAAVGGIGAGAFKGGEVHINAQRINSTTGLHEAVTPIAAKLATTNPDLLNNFYDQIRNSDAYEGLKDFEALYEDDMKKEEVVTEYLARVAAGQIDVTPTVLEQIKAFIQSILDKVGLNVFDINLNDETDIRFFAGKLADSLKTGGKIDLDQMTDVERNQLDPLWHGSPHDFNQFTTKAMGTGEGAQAFGWGLYFTDQESIGRYYAKALSTTQSFINGIPAEESAIGKGLFKVGGQYFRLGKDKDDLIDQLRDFTTYKPVPRIGKDVVWSEETDPESGDTVTLISEYTDTDGNKQRPFNFSDPLSSSAIIPIGHDDDGGYYVAHPGFVANAKENGLRVDGDEKVLFDNINDAKDAILSYMDELSTSTKKIIDEARNVLSNPSIITESANRNLYKVKAFKDKKQYKQLGKKVWPIVPGITNDPVKTRQAISSGELKPVKEFDTAEEASKWVAENNEYDLLEWNKPIKKEQYNKIKEQFDKELGDLHESPLPKMHDPVDADKLRKQLKDVLSAQGQVKKDIDQLLKKHNEVNGSYLYGIYETRYTRTVSEAADLVEPVSSDDAAKLRELDSEFNRLYEERRSINESLANNREVQGRNIYQSLVTFFGDEVGMDYNEAQKQASMLLLRAGIDGNKLPAGSMGLGDGSKGFNYVIFDEMDVEVEEKVRFQRTSPDKVKAKNVLKQAFENGAINPQNRNQILNYVAQGFNLQPSDVDLLMKRIESGPRYVKAPRAIRNSRQMEGLAAFHSKYLSGKRGVPAKVQQLREQRSGSIVARVEAASNRAKKLGKMARESEFPEIDKLLRGQTTYANSPLRTEIKDLVVEMRQDVDNLSQTLLDEGYIEQRVLGTRTVAGTVQQINSLNAMVQQIQSNPNATANDKRRAGLYKKKAGELQGKLDDIQRQRDNIEANLGTYLTRAYEIYDNKDWKPSEQVYEAAIQFTMTDKNMTYDEAKDLTDKILKEKKVAIGNKRKGKEGSKDPSILKQIKDVPEPIRALYGEYTDPLQAYAETVFRLSSYIENARFLNDFRDIGLGFFVFEESDPSKPHYDDITKISAKGNESMAPLDGLWTYDGIYEALGGGDSTVRFSGPWKWVNTLNAVINWNKTVGSPQTHARNVVGNVPFMLGNGYFLSIDPRTWGNPTKAIAKAFRAVGRDATGKYGTKGDKYDSLLERLKQNGVIGQNLTTNMIDDILSSDDIPERLYRRRYNKRRGIFQRGKRIGKNAIEVLNTAYGAEDDFFKVTAYILEADQRAQAYFNKPYDQLTADEKAEVDEEAMEIVKNVLPNYSRIGKAIQTLSTFPLMGQFVSFASEALRVSYNTADLSIAELRSSNPKIRAIGGRRLVNQMMYSAFKASLIKGMAALMGATTEFVFHTAPHELFGLGDDEDKEEERAVREFMWEWVKNNDLAVLSIDKGVIRVQDISATDPHGNIVRTKNAIRMAQDNTKIPEFVWDEIVKPFFEPSILAQYAKSISEGKDTYDKQLTRSTAPTYEKAMDAAMFTIRTIGPSAINSAMKIKEGKATILGQMFGNTYNIDINRDFRYKIADYTSYKSGGDEEGIREKASEIFNSDRTDEEKQAWLDQLNKEREGSLNKLKVAYQRALLLEADPKTLRDMLKKALDANEERYVLYDSPYRPLTRRDITIYKK